MQICNQIKTPAYIRSFLLFKQLMRKCKKICFFSFQKVTIIILLSGCIVQNKFSTPHNDATPAGKKRLVIFRASTIVGSNPGKFWPPDCHILGIPSNGKRLTNFQLPLNGHPAFTFEIIEEDTGSITILMATENRLFGNKLFCDTTIQFKHLKIGDNYLHLNYYLQAIMDGSIRIPVIHLTKIAIGESSFPSRLPAKNKLALIYDISGDTIKFERNKGILTNQNNILRIHHTVIKQYISTKSLLASASGY
jgi:hypothetical protein